MKRVFIVFSVLTASAIFLSLTQYLHSKSNGSIVGYSGAPKATSGFESTCVSCHGGSPNTGPHSVNVSVSGNPVGFIPGQTYTITSKVVNATGTRAGFSMVCLDPAKASCGTFTAGTGTRIMSSGGRSYINHSGSTLKTWTFTWKAPTTNVPDSVTFYMASMELIGATENTYTGKFVFRKDNTITSVPENQTTDPLFLYPNPAQNQIRFSDGPVNFSIRSVQGTIVKEGAVNAGELVSLDGLPSGNYFWEADKAGKKQSGHLIIQP